MSSRWGWVHFPPLQQVGAKVSGRSRCDRLANSLGSSSNSKHRSRNHRGRFISPWSVVERAVVSWHWRFRGDCRSRPASGYRCCKRITDCSPAFRIAARMMETRLCTAGINVQLDACVLGGNSGRLRLASGQELACDGVLWATPAAPPEFLRTSALSIDDSGFLLVRDTLQSHSHAAVFGTGDCVSFLPQPQLPRNGVHAVRQGRVLFENVREFLHERPLTPFRPQRNCLCLMNTSDGEAILSYGSFATKGRLVRRWKERIDRAWLETFGLKPARSHSEGSGSDNPSLVHRAGMTAAHLMRCGGCGAKVSGDVLSSVLCDLKIPDDPRVLLGTLAGEDAAVHRVRADSFGIAADKLVEVQTVDYFRAFLDDPYLFGRIAALHSVSDLYAMNARPFSALAIATLPYARGPIQAAQLRSAGGSNPHVRGTRCRTDRRTHVRGTRSVTRLFGDGLRG